MASIYDWSTTAANNGTADADVPWPEGMARRQVNDSARSLMGRVAELLGDVGGALSAGGTANGLTVTANSAFTTYANGQIIAFRATASNTGAATLSVNAIGAKAIRKMDNTGDVALAANDIRINGIYVAQYSTALNSAAGAWLLVNPTLSAAVYALSGLTTTDNAVARFDGTAGKIQNSGVLIDDTNNVTMGSGTDISPSDLAPGQARFLGSGYNGYVALDAAAMHFGHNSPSRDITFDLNETTAVTISGGSLTSATHVVSQSGVFRGTATQNIFGTLGPTGDAGTLFFRPQGYSSSVSQMTLNSAGALTISGTATATSFIGSGASLTALNAAQLTTGTVPSARISGSYTGVTGTGALAAGSITSGFGSIDIGADALTAGAVSGTTGTFSGAVTSSERFISSGNDAVLANNGVGGIDLRPNGAGTNANATRIANNGDVTIAGTLTTEGTVTSSERFVGAADVVLATTGLGTVHLRPNGVGTGANGTTIDSNGDMVVLGDVTATNFITTSDASLKHNIRPLDGAGVVVDAISAAQFAWNENDAEEFGFIADDFEKIAPHAVVIGKDGIKRLKPMAILAILWNAVREKQ